MVFLGAHVSIAGGIEHAVSRASVIGAETFQIFTKSQLQWSAKPLTAATISAFVQRFQTSPHRQICVHASYLINLASPEPAKLAQSRAALIDEIHRTGALGISYIVVHSGAHMGGSKANGLAVLAESVAHVLAATAKYPDTVLLLENSAGQGTTLCSTLHEMQTVQNSLSAERRLGFCLDTCHLFAAGKDFLDEKNYHVLCDEIEQTIRCEKVAVLHFNDSAKPLGSRVDNHEEIGEGFIGERPFGFWIRDRRWYGKTVILETPGGEENYRRELEILKRLRRQ